MNKKLLQIIENSPVNLIAPADSKKLANFYKKEIDKYRVVIQSFKTLLNYLNPLLNLFEEHLENIPRAKKMYEKYFSFLSKSAPSFGIIYLSEKYYNEFMEIYLEYVQKQIELLTKQNNDPEVKERAYVMISAILPIRTLFDIIKEKMKEKR